MKRCIAALFVCAGIIAGYCSAAEPGFIGKEPTVEVLEAPLYPGSVFIRTMISIDPFYESVFYVTPDPVVDVKNYFIEKLPDTRVVQYKDEYEWVWTFLLKKWIPFPDKPTRDDLPLLDVSPNVEVKKYQKILHEPLVEFLEGKPEAKKQLEALRSAKTIVRYTYRKVEEDIGFSKIRGVWKNTDRSLGKYYGCVIRFNADSTYTLILTEKNMSALVLTPRFAGKTPLEAKQYLREHNPETGRFSILRNTIAMETEEPLVGGKLKSGLTEIKAVTMSVQFINMPRLTFIREREQ